MDTVQLDDYEPGSDPFTEDTETPFDWTDAVFLEEFRFSFGRKWMNQEAGKDRYWLLNVPRGMCCDADGEFVDCCA